MATKFASVNTGLDRWSRQWEVQKAPFRKPLPYTFNRRVETQYPQYGSQPGAVYNDAAYGATVIGSAEDSRKLNAAIFSARNRAISKMKGDAQAQLGLMLATWEETSSLIVSASNAAKDFTDTERKQRLIAKLRKRGSVSNTHLMFIFGVLPTALDLKAAAEVLSKPFPVKETRIRRTATSASVSKGGSYRGTLYSEYGVLVGGTVRVTNPKLSFANDLGLINPLSIAWDKIPFSFLINMFCPVGAFFNSLTDLVGYEVIDGFHTTFQKKTWNGEVFVQPAPGQNNVWRSRFVRQLRVQRQLGVPDPKLPPVRCPEPTLFNTTMALSLLDQKIQAWKEIAEVVQTARPPRIR